MPKNSKQNPPGNPYANAAGAYDQHARANTPDQRELEARVLLKSVQKMRQMQDNWKDMTPESLNETLTYNRNIWMMFVDAALDDKDPNRPDALRASISSLGAFIFKHTVSVLADPQKEKLDILMEINREIAAGLMTKPDAAGAKEGEKKAPQKTSAASIDTA